MYETMAKTGMVALLGVTTPIGGTEGDWAQWGLAGLVVMYTLWRDHERERRMSTAIENHQNWVRDTLAQSLNNNANTLQRIEQHMTEKNKKT